MKLQDMRKSGIIQVHGHKLFELIANDITIWQRESFGKKENHRKISTYTKDFQKI